MFSISQFRANLAVVRPNMFFAEIDLPPELRAIFLGKTTEAVGTNSQTYKLAGSAVRGGGATSWFNSFDGADINTTFRFRCEATELPGRTVATSDDQNFGPTTKHAYEHNYNDLNLQIIASEDMRERAFFETWIENTVNNSNLTGGMRGKGGLSKYYNQYATGQVRLYQVNGNRKQLARYTLYNAYPVGISSMNLTWEEQNTYQRFAVTMTYRYHIVDFEQGTINLPGDNATGTTNTGTTTNNGGTTTNTDTGVWI